MSKKRPSGKPEANSNGALSRRDPAYWRRRLHRGTYRYRGLRRQVRAWYVKVQHQGVRKTIVLVSSDPAEAAREACERYCGIVRQGWGKPLPTGAKPVDGAAQREPTLKACSQPCLIRRKYVHQFRVDGGSEWSVLIEHEGRRLHFPLGTNDEAEAAQRALERHQTLTGLGLANADLIYEREVTLGVFWTANPLAITYTTLLTLPAKAPLNGVPLTGRTVPRLLLVESESAVRRALEYWLPRHQQSRWMVLPCAAKDLLAQVAATNPQLVLINHSGNDEECHALLNALALRHPDLPAFAYGSYEDSDDLFRSVSGISAGYLLRRRPPELWLEPVTGYSAGQPLTGRRVHQLVRRYFFTVFDQGASLAGPPRHAPLTAREQEILALLSNGLQHKQIAGELGISINTVQTHVRMIFEKLCVHSRTEAVVKYLQL